MQITETRDDDFAALLTGFAPSGLNLPDGPIEDREVLQMLRQLAVDIRSAFSPASWMLRDRREVVGLCSIVRLPAADDIDTGYGVATARRNKGFATAGIKCLLEWARAGNRVSVVRAETSISNIASQPVLGRNGFRQTGNEQIGRMAS